MDKSKARSCTGKLRQTKDQAWAQFRDLRRKGAIGIHVYKCKYCKKYHVGHMSRRWRRWR